MKIEIDTQLTHSNTIESYSSEGIVINKIHYADSILVGPELLVADWAPQSCAELSFEHFRQILDLAPEIILLGTGKRLRFPDNDILMAIMSRNIGIEVMDTRAACRAYNLIAGEGRVVVAALLGIET
jgi:uncharacterized protein